MSTEYNPYSAPASVVSDRADDQQNLASKGRRFGTLVIDYVFFYLIIFAIGFIIGITHGSEGVAKFPWQLIGLVVLLSYYLFFEGLWQRTPGKFILGTMVVNGNGEKPSFGQILGRTLCRFIPFEPFSFFGREGWHDSISKTKVVMTRGG
ncbi:RDD family protein [Dyella nitratireducens]|nr:RDD family protein [Dyella nitratireducens]